MIGNLKISWLINILRLPLTCWPRLLLRWEVEWRLVFELIGNGGEFNHLTDILKYK